MAEDAGMQIEKEEEKTGEMDPSWQTLYDDLKDPNVSKEGKDKIWTFIHNESRLFMEFAYPSLNMSVEDMHKAIDELKKGQWQEDGRQAEELC